MFARSLRAIAVAAVLVVGVPVAASADPAGPTHYRSEVVAIEGTDGVVSAEVHGGDAFLSIEVESGHEVVVPGYDDEEAYLRVDVDGNVFVNTRSAAYYQNLERYGAPVPRDAGPELPPTWQQVADGGRFAWHDHRVHWMSPSLPRDVDRAGGAQQVGDGWRVPLVVDGQDAVIRGTLTWLPAASPGLPIGIAVVALAAAVLAVRRWPVGGAAGGVLGVGLVALLVGVVATTVMPPGVDVQPFLVPLPALVVFVALIGALIAARRPLQGRVIIGLAALPLVAWAVAQSGALTRPVLPFGLPDALVRATVGLAAGAGVGVGAATLTEALRQGLALPEDV